MQTWKEIFVSRKEALMTKAKIKAEADKIYREAMNSGDPEAVRQALTCKLMFISGAWFALGLKK